MSKLTILKKLIGKPVYYYYITYSDSSGSMKNMVSFASKDTHTVVLENDSTIVLDNDNFTSVAKNEVNYGISLNKPLVSFRFAHPLYGNSFDFMCYSTEEKSPEEIKSFIRGELHKISGGLLGFNLGIVDEV